uniref:Uncharacterized protein n=1 Tax=Phlebotomus papatasi TaxID=29031 RepID=A0A1B0DIY9_PHLPP
MEKSPIGKESPSACLVIWKHPNLSSGTSTSLLVCVILYIVLRTCVIGKPVPESVIDFIDFFCGKSRSAK